LTEVGAYRQGIYQSAWVRKIALWLDAQRHPPIAIEIAPDRISGARFTHTGSLDSFAVEGLPAGAIAPSAVETNIVNAAAVRVAVEGVCDRLRAKNEIAALLLPDTVIRVFVQHFDQFPRSAKEAIPMLRWKLKKSVPFEVDETLISYMRQAPREGGVDVVTALGRLRIVREYEAAAEQAGVQPGVVLSASLAAVALLADQKPSLLARVSGTSLTTAIVREGVLCGYRCTELPAQVGSLTPQMLLEEIYPVAAYYQDTWREGIQSVRVAGLGARLPEFVPPLEKEFHCEVHSLLHTAISEGRVSADARPLAERELEGLVGWMMQKN
jgi:type IV pilus assembly protein PilM